MGGEKRKTKEKMKSPRKRKRRSQTKNQKNNINEKHCQRYKMVETKDNQKKMTFISLDMSDSKWTFLLFFQDAYFNRQYHSFWEACIKIDICLLLERGLVQKRHPFFSRCLFQETLSFYSWENWIKIDNLSLIERVLVQNRYPFFFSSMLFQEISFLLWEAWI